MIRVYIASHNLSQDSVADSMKVSKQTFSKWLNGENAFMSGPATGRLITYLLDEEPKGEQHVGQASSISTN